MTVARLLRTVGLTTRHAARSKQRISRFVLVCIDARRFSMEKGRSPDDQAAAVGEDRVMARLW